MALEWAVLGLAAAVEAVLLILITMPGLSGLRRQLLALEWAVLGLAAAVEAVLLILITMPGLSGLRRQLLALSRTTLQPLLAVVPFSFFLMLEIYWQFENMPECSGSSCNVPEQDRLSKKMMMNQRNMILVASSLLMYWLLYRVTAILVRVEASNVQINKLKFS